MREEENMREREGAREGERNVKRDRGQERDFSAHTPHTHIKTQNIGVIKNNKKREK